MIGAWAARSSPHNASYARGQVVYSDLKPKKEEPKRDCKKLSSSGFEERNLLFIYGNKMLKLDEIDSSFTRFAL
jgi:hypothetical protein